MQDGRTCRDVRLRFEAGVVVEASAALGEDVLLARLDTDEGARRVGEFAIGTNEMITRAVGDTLFDEKIGGTCHLALGRSFPLLGGENVSAIHWDLVCDLRAGGRIDADGEPCWSTGGCWSDGSLRRPLRARDRRARARRARGPERADRGRRGRRAAARAVHRRVLEAGGHPSVQMLPGRLDRGQGRVREPTRCWPRPTRSSSSGTSASTAASRCSRSRTSSSSRTSSRRAPRPPRRGACARCTCSSTAMRAARRRGAARSIRPPPTPRPPASRWTATATCWGARSSSTSPTRGGLARPGRAAGRARRAARERRRAAHRGRGHRPARARRRPALDQRLGPPQPARRRGLHGPARERHRGRRDVRDAVGLGRSARRGRASALRGGALRRGRGRERRRSCTPRSTPTRARARWASSRSASTRRSWRRHSTRCWTRRWAARCTWRSAPPMP